MSRKSVVRTRRHRRVSSVRRPRLALALSVALALGGVAFVPWISPAEAAAVSIVVDKSAPSSVLVGAPITYSVKAANPADDGDADFQYNLTFRDVLPKGVTYVSTSAPAGLGDPQQIAERGTDSVLTGRTILIWSNVADLPDGSGVTLSYQVQPDAALYPVGAQVTNGVTGYSSSDERQLAKFDAGGTHIPAAAIKHADSTATTSISAIRLEKSEPSSERELVRGVHDRTTVYTLKVTNNGVMPTTDVAVVDYLPAGLEFLGCGQVDNSVAGFEEYPGSGRLDSTPAVTTADGCLAPYSVTTVDSGLPAGYPAGVYTRVEWRLSSTLAANGNRTIRYAAGIPLRSNVMPAAGFVATANLQNNTGASTRETDTEIALTNRARASGVYQGLNAQGQTGFEVSDATTNTVTAEDIAVAKSIKDADAFTQGGEAEYRLLIRTSEYTDGSDIVLVDTMPDGLCPSDAPAGAYTAAALDAAGTGGCAPVTGTAAIETVDFVGGVFVVTFERVALTADDGATTVSYHARMRETYNSTDEQTSAGDSYTNKVALTGTTSPIVASSESGTQVVEDVSEATLTSAAPTLDKRILGNTAAPHSCNDNSWTTGTTTGNWFNSQAATADTPFTVGSRVCFQVRVMFPTDTSTREPVVTDYLPDNLAYEPGSFELVPDVNTTPMTVDPTAINTAFATGTASFTPGTAVGDERYVAKGQVFAFRFSAIVKSNTIAAVDVQGNLAKLRWTNHSGQVSSLRDTADFRVPPVPPVKIDKQVAKAPYSTYGETQTVVHGDVVRFRIGLTNQGVTPVGDIDVWDVLPAPFTCAAVSAITITAGGVCTDPGVAGHPAFSGRGTLSAIRWVLPATVAAGGTSSLTYDVTMPTPTTVDTAYTNTAHVRSYTTPTNLGGVGSSNYPTGNVDTTVPPASQTAPAAKDTAAVKLPKVGVTKSRVTAVVEPGNTAAQAVPGETITYTIRAAVPAHTTVYGGVLTDPMPTDVKFVSATAGYSASNASPAVDALPGDTVFDATTARLTLPPTFTNATDSVQVFQVNVVAKVVASQTGAVSRTNTATFASKTLPAGSTGIGNVANVTATSPVAIVHPAASLAKMLFPVDQTATPSAGESRQFRLGATNPGVAPLHDTRVVDCVPAGLTVTALGTGPDMTQAPRTADDGCAFEQDATTITWRAGSIAAGATAYASYTVTVNADAAGGQTYTNVATLTGSSLADGANTAANEEVLTATDNKALSVPPAGITKTVANDTLTVGERAEYTLTATFPANARFYNALVSDLMPPGLDLSSVDTTSVTCTDSAGTCVTPANGTAMTRYFQTIGWFLGDLESSTRERTIRIVFTALVEDNCTSPLGTTCNIAGESRSNSAVVRWDLADKPDPVLGGAAPDRSTESSPVVFTVQEPKTVITKSVGGTTPAPGDTFTYTVTASNPGGTDVSDAHNVVVKDVVPAGVVIDGTTITGGGTYDGETRTISWDVPVLTAATGSDHSKTFTYAAKLASSGSIDGTAITNTAKVTAFRSIPNGGRTYVGPDASAAVTPQLPHTSVTKRVVDSAVSYVGEAQTFEVVVTNDGTAPAHKIDVTDVLPKNWQLGTSTVKIGDGATTPVPPTMDNAGNPQTATWDDLAPSGLAVGKTIVITYTATPLPGALTDAGAGSANAHINTVTINAEDRTGATSSGKGSYHGGPATATARIHSADLQVSKSGVGTPVAGQPFSWKVKVHNNGGDPAAGPIVVTDTVPASVSSFSLTGAGWTCTSTETVWTCTRPGPIASSGDAPDLTATGTIDPDVTNGTDLVNTATVSSRTYDPVRSNDRSTATVGVTTLADLSVAKSLTGVITAGQAATWTLDVNNLGPSTSRGPITVKDTLPDSATFVSATGDGWTCDEEDGVVTCERTDDLPASGASAAGQITIVAKIAASQKAAVVNTATVSGTTTEPSTTAATANNTDTVSTTPTRTADLFLQKSLVSATAAVPGTDLTYELEVTNNGPSTASGVTITDTLPSYMTFVSGGNADWDCSADGRRVVCELDGSLGVAADDVARVRIVANVASDRTGEIVNVATATATEDPTGSTDDDTNTPTLRSDLAITKSHTGDATAGEAITYRATVKNNGPSDTAGPLTVIDTVPTGTTYASVAGAGWACDEEDGTVTCTHAGGLANGASRTLDLTFDVAVDAGPASVVNNVSVDGPNTDPEIGNNTDDDPTDIVDDANLRITKAAAVATTHAGTQSSWTIAVVNEGPSTADSVSVSDELPPGLGVVSISGSGWTCDETTLSCTRPTLAPGAAPLITVVTEVGSGVVAGTTLVNAATVTTSTQGDDVDDNDDSDDLGVTTSADLTLAKTHTGTPVAGETFSFDLTAHNDGPSDALGPITISDELPAGMTYVSANDAWACLPAPVSSSGQEVFCTLVSGGPVISGEGVPTLTMTVDIASDQAGETLVNTAEVDSSTPDPTAGNNQDRDTVVPTDAVDLSIVKSHAGPVRVGDELVFTLGVANAGPSEARDVEVGDALPKGLTFVSATGQGWTCAAAACTLVDPLAPGDTAGPLTVVTAVTPEAYPGVTNVATVSTSSHETKPADNVAEDDVIVPAKVNLSLVKRAEGALRVGAPASYSLTVHNDGPTPDPGVVTVTDQLPAGLTYVEAKAAGWECGAVSQLVTCTRKGDLPIDASERIALTVDVGAAAYPSVTNTAQVGSRAEETDPADNTANAESPVAGRSLMTIAKSLERQSGSAAVWKIEVGNAGPTETTAPITIVDHLPTGLAFVSAKGAGWDCAVQADLPTCTSSAAMPVGATASVEIRTKITVDDGSKVVNVATVEGGDTVQQASVASDDANVTAPRADDDEASDGPGGLLPDTGGVAFWVLLAGLALVLSGGLLLTRRRQES